MCVCVCVCVTDRVPELAFFRIGRGEGKEHFFLFISIRKYFGLQHMLQLSDKSHIFIAIEILSMGPSRAWGEGDGLKTNKQ